MKKKRYLVYKLIALILIGFIVTFYNAFNGNPISEWIAFKKVEKHVASTYPDREFRVQEGFYDFKFGEYLFNVIEIGSVDETNVGPKEYEFRVRGFFSPAIVWDGVRYSLLDQSLMTRLSREAEIKIKSLLTTEVENVKEVGIQLEVLKGQLPKDIKWEKDVNLDSPMDIHIVIDSTNSTKEETVLTAKKIQDTLKAQGISYKRVTINGNVFGLNEKEYGAKASHGYVKYSFSFEPDTTIRKKDIQEENK
ncbi:YfjL-like protein [Litchfieldia alkalitelluris]|uniref:YfjL-like protein n=1 Tax=Litchfieldia alkalitelluris TaxID=304268 RepID=UPI000996FD66|nr:hypothetical protein [Litchfieldia alkalitelluris]